MGENLDKLRKTAQPRSEEAKGRARWRRENREWLRMSQSIALQVLDYLHNAGLTQKELAERMGVSPAYIAKLVKGSENLSLETICKLHEALGIKLVYVAEPYSSPMTIVLQNTSIIAQEMTPTTNWNSTLMLPPSSTRAQESSQFSHLSEVA